MSGWAEFIQRRVDASALALAGGGEGGVTCFSDVAAEHAALRSGPAIAYRSDRGLLEVTGADRSSWLHNLTTNQVKTLLPGQGNYLFVCNAAGRILFDANVLVRPDSIWVDLDRALADMAIAHFDKYTIMEDVQVADLSDRYIRLALIGADCLRVLGEHGLSNAGNLPLLESAAVEIGGAAVALTRTDFCGRWAVELFAEADHAPAVWTALTGGSVAEAAMPVGSAAIEVQRIEAGIPRSGREITEETLPGETGQADRAVNTNKGCYIGQEVIERMRSRGVVARKLVGLVLGGERVPAVGSEIQAAGKTVGLVTSSCHSMAMSRPVALGYVKPDWAEAGVSVSISFENTASDQGARAATVCGLPFSS